METQEVRPEDEVATEPEATAQEPFTLEAGKERATEAVERVKQASKNVTTRPILDAVGSYVNRAIDAIIGLAEGIDGKDKKKDSE